MRIEASGGACRDLARQPARINFDRILATLNGHAHPESLGVDEIGLSWQTHEMHRVAAEQHFGRQQRPVGCAHDEDFVGVRHEAGTPCRKSIRRRVWTWTDTLEIMPFAQREHCKCREPPTVTTMRQQITPYQFKKPVEGMVLLD